MNCCYSHSFSFHLLTLSGLSDFLTGLHPWMIECLSYCLWRSFTATWHSDGYHSINGSSVHVVPILDILIVVWPMQHISSTISYSVPLLQCICLNNDNTMCFPKYILNDPWPLTIMTLTKSTSHNNIYLNKMFTHQFNISIKGAICHQSNSANCSSRCSSSPFSVL